MKRDIHQEMTEASNRYAQSITDSVGVQSMLSIAFCEGVRWADKHPKTSTLNEASRKKQQVSKTLYGQFKDILDILMTMSDGSNSAYWSQYIKEHRANFNVRFDIDDEDTINIELELRRLPE